MPLKKNQWVCGSCFRVNRTDFDRCYDCGISREESNKILRRNKKLIQSAKGEEVKDEKDIL